MNSVNIEDKAVLWQGDLEMLSYGGGVNTVAMTHRLVNEGWRGAIVMADTGGERPETYCHVAWMDEWLKTRGLHIERVACSMPPADLVERAAKSISDRRMLGQTLEGFCLPARG